MNKLTPEQEKIFDQEWELNREFNHTDKDGARAIVEYVLSASHPVVTEEENGVLAKIKLPLKAQRFTTAFDSNGYEIFSIGEIMPIVRLETKMILNSMLVKAFNEKYSPASSSKQ